MEWEMGNVDGGGGHDIFFEKGRGSDRERGRFRNKWYCTLY